MKNVKYSLVVFLLLIGITSAQAQELTKEQLELEKETDILVAEGNEQLFNDDFIEAEANYRKAIAINPKEEVGKYNLGNAYYNEKKNEEAMRRYQQAAGVAQTRAEKHKAFHNLGNTFMNAKQYEPAVEAYKNALRNNPTDDETRYNLALAKEMLEKNPPQGGDGEDENKDQQENQDQQNQNDNKENEGDNKDQNENQEYEDKDQGDKKDQNQGDEEGENEQPQQPNDQKEGEGDQQKQPQQPKQGQMSPQQIKNLLEAMNNEEKKVQDKINVQKQKGAKIKSNKDW